MDWAKKQEKYISGIKTFLQWRYDKIRRWLHRSRKNDPQPDAKGSLPDILIPIRRSSHIRRTLRRTHRPGLKKRNRRRIQYLSRQINQRIAARHRIKHHRI